MAWSFTCARPGAAHRSFSCTSSPATPEAGIRRSVTFPAIFAARSIARAAIRRRRSHRRPPPTARIGPPTISPRSCDRWRTDRRISSDSRWADSRRCISDCATRILRARSSLPVSDTAPSRTSSRNMELICAARPIMRSRSEWLRLPVSSPKADTPNACVQRTSRAGVCLRISSPNTPSSEWR